MKVLFLILARGGSKGFPGKNLAALAGIPLVGRAARLGSRTASQLGGDCRVVCSTDSPVLAEAARAWGAETPFLRPANLASDAASSIDAILHALQSLHPADFDRVVLLQPTSPLTEVEDVTGTLGISLATGDPAVSICRSEHPAHWQFRMDARSVLLPTSSDEVPHRRQDIPPSYRLNGAVYAASPHQLASFKGFLSPSTRGYEMPAERSVDVDCPTDLVLARGLIEARPIRPADLGGKKVGPDQPCFIIAEAGVNHNGSLDLAMRLVDAAAEAGADAVKFQTFRADLLVTRDAAKAEYQLRSTPAEESQYEMLKRLELDERAHRELMARCKEKGILFLSTPFDEESCDLLASLGVSALKLGSGELTNEILLRHAARKTLPLIVSTGMATLQETARAVDVLRDSGCRELVLLHCVSNYPADPADANLRAIATLRAAFGVPAGFSDHTEGDAVALAAIALGACVLEKHFTLDRSLPGPDHRASIEPGPLTALVRRCRAVESSLGSGHKIPGRSELLVAQVARKSLVSARMIPSGATLEPSMVCLKRPGTGLVPGALGTLLGKKAVRDIPEGVILEGRMFE